MNKEVVFLLVFVDYFYLNEILLEWCKCCDGSCKKIVFDYSNYIWVQMDAEVISAGILREVVEAGGISMYEVKDRIGLSVAHLLHESFRVNNIASKVDIYDDETASALGKFCLTYYDVRALILHLAVKLDMLRYLEYLPRYQQQIISLELKKIHAPLAHAVRINSLSLELEDLSF